MTVNTAAGSKLFVGGTGPLESEAAWVEVGEIANLPEFGRVYEEVVFSDLSNRDVRKLKGTRNDGDLTLELGQDINDDGQQDLWDALDSDFDYNFRITLNDASTATDATPTAYEFQAKVMSFQTGVGDPNSIVSATVGIGIQSGTLVRTPAT
ncbi:MAG: hypothetical protein AAF942_00070 [Pseudomonadota bacterium]